MKDAQADKPELIEKDPEAALKDITELSLEELTKSMEAWGEKPFRAKQIYQWIHQKLAESFEEMSNLSINLRNRLETTYRINSARIIRRQTSKLDGTSKFLMELADGNTVESVLMKYHHGNSVCISSQVGCRMGCRFCASTVGGLVRSLTASEMLAQIYAIQRETGERVSNIIIMGIGEPFDNYDNFLKFVHRISDENGLHISQRNITVSTCGLVDKIYDLAEEGLQITLAISLHAPNDTLRREMMPVANKFTIEEIIEACREYIKKTGRRVTFEYSMIEGKNDSPAQAEQLVGLLNGLNCHVNLIPLNKVEGRFGSRSSQTGIQNFKSILEKNRINVTVRREMGSDIDAACGQLRNKASKA